ncbi:ribokinase [SAR202 cluster bacterium AD-802-E10_MRT_200m]|nr:ribokinase [SAR202 cluster bacterium AD-802-E10_MRT_200m]
MGLLMRVVVIGGINMDLVVESSRMPRPGETLVGTRFFKTYGGKGANQATGIAKLGERALLVGRVGCDSFGEELRDGLNLHGVDTSQIKSDSSGSSGIAVITIEPDGQNRIIQIPGVNDNCNNEELERTLRVLTEADVLMLQLEVPAWVSIAAAKVARSLGKVVLFNPAPIKPFSEEIYSYIDYMTPNEVEAEALLGETIQSMGSAANAAKKLLLPTMRAVIITLGESGACFASHDTAGCVPGFPVKAVDTVGAGDAFNAALVLGLASGDPIKKAMIRANAAGALAVTKPGAQESMPLLVELDSYMSDNT